MRRCRPCIALSVRPIDGSRQLPDPLLVVSCRFSVGDEVALPVGSSSEEEGRERENQEAALHARHCVTEVTVTSLGELAGQGQDRGVDLRDPIALHTLHYGWRYHLDGRIATPKRGGDVQE